MLPAPHTIRSDGCRRHSWPASVVAAARPNLRRLPKWHRPDKPRRSGATLAGPADGRLCAKPGVMGRAIDAEDQAAAIARSVARAIRSRVARLVAARASANFLASRSTTSSSASSFAARCGADTSCAGWQVRSSRCRMQSSACARLRAADAIGRSVLRYRDERSRESIHAAARGNRPRSLVASARRRGVAGAARWPRRARRGRPRQANRYRRMAVTCRMRSKRAACSRNTCAESAARATCCKVCW